MRISRSPDGDGGTVPVEAGKTAAQINDQQTGRIEPAVPPAAVVVKNAEVTEEVLRLRAKQADLENQLKAAQTDAAHHADEARRLKDAGLRPAPAAVEDDRSTLEKFMAGEDV